MKEFEKIWENYYANYSSYEGIKHEQNMARHFHRAALEWVAKRGMHHYGNDFLIDMNELSTEIQIELGMLDERGKVVR